METFFHNRIRFGIKPGLERIRTLLDFLGNPEKTFKSIHITGTNGKGSVTAILAHILTACGFRTGSFTSPHLHHYNERIAINKVPVDPDDILESILALKPALDGCVRAGLGEPTEFEILTAAAFDIFRRHQVELAVVEVGLGGTQDSTNVLEPCCAAVTNVRLDHQDVLGTTLNDIIRNKAGITKPGITVICGDNDPSVAALLAAEILRLGGTPILAHELVRLEQIVNLGWEGFTLDVVSPHLHGHDIKFSLPGSYQMENLNTALAVIEQLIISGVFTEYDQVLPSLGSVLWPGRFELLRRSPDVVADAAHNPSGAGALVAALNDVYPGKHRLLVIGVLDNKDAAGIFTQLRPATRLCIITRPDGPRGAAWLERVKEAESIFSYVTAVESIEAAVQQALDSVWDDEYILITGSFYTLDRARKMFTNTY